MTTTTTTDKPFKRGKYWYIRFEGPPDPLTGERKQIMRSCRGLTYKQAEQRLREEKSKVARGEFAVDSQHQTMADYLKMWIDTIKPSISVGTYDNYALQIRAHLIPGLGKVKLEELTTLQIQRFYAKLQKVGSNHNTQKRGLAPKTIKNIHGVLHQALQHAIKWNLRTNNPCEAVELPKRTRRQVKSTSLQGVHDIMSAVEQLNPATRHWRMPVLIGVDTGMRRGEILGLQWQDFDQERKALYLRRAIVQTISGEILVKTLKDDNFRVVKINASLVETLQKHFEQSSFQRPTDWICCDEQGGYHSPKRFSRFFTIFAKRIGVNITPHGMRHTHATTLIQAGVPVKVVSERLGHTTIEMTQDMYMDVLPDMQSAAADTVETLYHRQEVHT